MTDTLRTRIAKAISDELFVRDAYTEYGTDGEPGQWERVDGHINLTALTDAVIRELQLTEDGGVIVGCIHD